MCILGPWVGNLQLSLVLRFRVSHNAVVISRFILGVTAPKVTHLVISSCSRVIGHIDSVPCGLLHRVAPRMAAGFPWSKLAREKERTSSWGVRIFLGSHKRIPYHTLFEGGSAHTQGQGITKKQNNWSQEAAYHLGHNQGLTLSQAKIFIFYH